MASTSSSSSSSFVSSARNEFSPRITRQTSKTSLARPRKSTAPEFGTPIRLESSSPYRTPTSNSKASAFLAKTPFGTPNRTTVVTATTSLPPNVQSSTVSSQPVKPLTGRAQLSARIRSLWLGGDTATALLQAKGYLPYTGLAKLMLQTNFDRLYFLSIIAIHVFLCISLSSPLHLLSSVLLPFRPLVMLLSILAFSSSILPLIILRKSEVSAIKNTAIKESAQQTKSAGMALARGSPAAHYLEVLIRPRTSLLIGLYALSGLFLATFQAIGLLLYSSNPEAWLPYQSVSFRNPQGLRVFSLRPNERLFFLLGSNLVLGILYILYRSLSLSPANCDTTSPHSTVIFEPQSTVESLSGRLSSKMRRKLPRVIIAGSVLPSILLLLYFSLRRPVFRLILSVIGHNSSLRPILIPSFRLHFLSFDLVFRTTSLGIFSTVTWETFNILWETLATQPFTDLPGGLSRFSREPTKCLIEGMQSRKMVSGKENDMSPQEKHYLSHFAFAEASILTSTDYERRRTIFREVGSTNVNIVDGSSKSAWVSIAQECVKVLQEERLSLATKGRQTAAAASSSTSSASSSTLPHLKVIDSSHQALVESGSSFINKRPVSIWDKLASHNSTPDASTTLTPSAATATTTASPSNDLSAIMHRLAPPPATKQTTQTQSATKPLPTSSTSQSSAISTLTSLLLTSFGSVLQTVYLFLPHDLRHVLSRLPFVTAFNSANKRLFTLNNQTLLYIGLIPKETALTTWSIQILSALLSASVDQDEYGTVALSKQHKLGVEDILEEIASLLFVLKQWGQEIAVEMQGESESSKHQMTILWDQRVAPMVIASRNAIRLVVGVFEPTGFVLSQVIREKIDKAMSM